MRKLRWISAVLMAASIAVPAQQDDDNSGMCPMSPRLGDVPSQKFWVRGTLAGQPVRMYLERGGDVVLGTFFYPHSDNWAPVDLAGKWDHGTVLAVVQPHDQMKPRRAYTSTGDGRLEAKLTPSGFIGTWTPPNSQTAVPIHLTLEPQPRCDGTGPQKRFNDPHWPITFSYPASWHLDEDRPTDVDGFRLICPNAALMAYDVGIDIEQGTTTDPGSLLDLDAQGFHASGKTWDHHFLRGDTVDAVGKQQHGMIVVDGDGDESRLYCRSGGYIGQGEGHHRLLVVGTHWVTMNGDLDYRDAVLRIVASARPRSH